MRLGHLPISEAMNYLGLRYLAPFRARLVGFGYCRFLSWLENAG